MFRAALATVALTVGLALGTSFHGLRYTQVTRYPTTDKAGHPLPSWEMPAERVTVTHPRRAWDDTAAITAVGMSCAAAIACVRPRRKAPPRP